MPVIIFPLISTSETRSATKGPPFEGITRFCTASLARARRVDLDHKIQGNTGEGVAARMMELGPMAPQTRRHTSLGCSERVLHFLFKPLCFGVCHTQPDLHHSRCSQ